MMIEAPLPRGIEDGSIEHLKSHKWFDSIDLELVDMHLRVYIVCKEAGVNRIAKTPVTPLVTSLFPVVLENQMYAMSVNCEKGRFRTHIYPATVIHNYHKGTTLGFAYDTDDRRRIEVKTRLRTSPYNN